MSCGCRPPTLTGASTLIVSFTFSGVVSTGNPFKTTFKTAFYPPDINLYIAYILYLVSVFYCGLWQNK